MLMPSMLWLQLFFVVSLPSILINTIRTLNSCGIEFDELKELMVNHQCLSLVVHLIFHGSPNRTDRDLVLFRQIRLSSCAAT